MTTKRRSAAGARTLDATYAAVLACIFFSGFTALLLYETTWLRLADVRYRCWQCRFLRQYYRPKRNESHPKR